MSAVAAVNAAKRKPTKGGFQSGVKGMLGGEGRALGAGNGAGWAGGEGEDGVRSEMLEINDFLFRARVDNVNIFKVQRYMRRSEIARKVRTPGQNISDF